MMYPRYRDTAKSEVSLGSSLPNPELTKPVYLATTRALPRWVGWILISLPSLSLLGSWMMGRLPVFQLITVLLFGIALWDWNQFFDRSRTMVTMLGLSAGVAISAIVATIVSRPPASALETQSISLISLIALTLALVQLYRSAETVLTIIRGWLYAIAILTAITVYQRITLDLHALNGPFPSPAYLAGSMVVGVLLMPIGFALEKDRRLRWAYLFIAISATWVVWTTHRSVAFACCLAILILWLATYRWIIATLVAAVGLVVAIVFRSVLSLRWSEVGLEPPLDQAVISKLRNAAGQILKDSNFLGVGPGGLATHWPSSLGGYQGPYSAAMEIASQYGLAIAIALICALLGLLTWAVIRLWQARKTRLYSPERAPAFWLAIVLISLPVTTSIQAQWLDFPLSALSVATITLLGRHIESRQGRALVWSADAQSSDPHSFNLQPPTSQSTDSQPSDSQPVDSQPADSQPADSQPSDSQPADS